MVVKAEDCDRLIPVGEKHRGVADDVLLRSITIIQTKRPGCALVGFERTAINLYPCSAESVANCHVLKNVGIKTPATII